MYASLVSFCDEQIGRILDAFDKHHLWESTMLVVNTDHGFLMVSGALVIRCALWSVLYARAR